MTPGQGLYWQLGKLHVVFQGKSLPGKGQNECKDQRWGQDKAKRPTSKNGRQAAGKVGAVTVENTEPYRPRQSMRI